MAKDRGQGLNSAMKDAGEIVDALIATYNNQKTLKEAIDSYEAEMIPRGAAEVGLTQELAAKRQNARYEDPLVEMGLKQAEVKVKV